MIDEKLVTSLIPIMEHHQHNNYFRCRAEQKRFRWAEQRTASAVFRFRAPEGRAKVVHSEQKSHPFEGLSTQPAAQPSECTRKGSGAFGRGGHD